MAALVSYAFAGDEAAPTAADPVPAVATPLPLPLDLDDVGFDDGTIVATAPAEGPDALSFCNNIPSTEGLVEWAGNRLTESDGRRRVAQLLVRFETSADAAAHMSSNSSIIDCERWDATTGAETVRFTVTEVVPEVVHGDETKQYDLTAITAGQDLFLRIALIRSGPDVAQFTIVSATRQDVDLLEGLVAIAVDELGYE